MPDREGEAGLLGQMRIGVDADIGDGEPLAGEEAALLQTRPPARAGPLHRATGPKPPSMRPAGEAPVIRGGAVMPQAIG